MAGSTVGIAVGTAVTVGTAVGAAVGAGAGAAGVAVAVGFGLPPLAPANGSTYWSSPALWAAAEAGSASTASSSAVTRRARIGAS